MPPVLWTERHFQQEYNLLVAAAQELGEGPAPEEDEEVKAPPVSLLVVSIPIQFIVREEELHKYVYTYTDVADALEAVAYRELVQYVAGVDLIRILGPDREKAGKDLERLIQAAADGADLGVDIIFVGLHGVHPPMSVAPFFEKPVSALEEREVAILEAEKYSIETELGSKAKAEAEVRAARAERFSRRTLARADAERFNTLLEAYGKAPRIFVFRWYVTTLEEILPGKGLVIAPAEAVGNEVVIIDLEKKPGSELLQVDVKPND